jgi:transposase
MLKLPSEVRVYIALEPCDMRRQIDGLSALIRSALERDPENGDLYLFCNRRLERPTFYIRIRQSQDCVSLAPAVRQVRGGGPSRSG